jgi:hypothetical protein
MQFQRRSELKCYHQVSSIQWSPTGEYLFVSTAYVTQTRSLSAYEERRLMSCMLLVDRDSSGVSLMWETLTWKKEIWDLATGVRLV